MNSWFFPVFETPIDISAARHADVLFVKQKGSGENDLAAYCLKEGIRHILFQDFSAALPIVQAVANGVMTLEQVLSASNA